MRLNSLPKEVQEAKRAYEIAQNHLDVADTPELIDAAIYELNAARIRLGVAIKAAGGGGREWETPNAFWAWIQAKRI